MVSEYRCETCKHHIGSGGSHNHFCLKKDYENNIGTGKRIYNLTFDQIKELGCASHSSFKSEREIVEGVYDDLGVLHGEAAERFEEYMNAPAEDPSEELRAIILAAQQIAEEMSDIGIQRKERNRILKVLKQWIEDNFDEMNDERFFDEVIKKINELRDGKPTVVVEKPHNRLRNGCEGCRYFISSANMECTYRDRDLDFEYIDRVGEHGCDGRKPI